MIYFIVIVIQMIQFLNFDKEPLKGIVYKRRKFSWWNIDNSNLLCLLTSFLSQIPCFASEDLSTSHFSYVLLWALTDSYKIAWQHFNIKYLFVRCVITNDSRIGQLGEKILILSHHLESVLDCEFTVLCQIRKIYLWFMFLPMFLHKHLHYTVTVCICYPKVMCGGIVVQYLLLGSPLG